VASSPRLFAVGEDFGALLKEAMERAGRLLSVRARTEKEIRDKLVEGDFEEGVIEATVLRLTELGLLDDSEFAREWVRERSARKGLGPRALEAELALKGVAKDIVIEAIRDEIGDEETRAAEVAASYVRKVVRFPLAEQGAKLTQMLMRRGFSYEAAERGAKAVLPPDGWD
jgi:regulatory protein